MADIIFVLVALAFFGLCVAYVRACDRLVRGSEGVQAATGEADAIPGVTPIAEATPR